jgi:hypothetical protein
MKIAEIVQIFGLLFSAEKVMHKFRQKMCWATFWAIFSQNHLVTLFRANISSAEGEEHFNQSVKQSKEFDGL